VLLCVGVVTFRHNWRTADALPNGGVRLTALPGDKEVCEQREPAGNYAIIASMALPGCWHELNPGLRQILRLTQSERKWTEGAATHTGPDVAKTFGRGRRGGKLRPSWPWPGLYFFLRDPEREDPRKIYRSCYTQLDADEARSRGSGHMEVC